MKALIDLHAMLDNLNQIKKLAQTDSVVAMVKANAYGHGMVPVARFLESNGVSHFGVATLTEGEVLRAAGIQSRILLMSGAGFLGLAERLVKARLTPLISSLEELKSIDALGVAMPVHVDLDTGLSRGGLPVSKVPELIRWWLSQKRNFILEALSTHFANAESPHCAFSKLQLQEFQSALQLFEQAGLKPKVLHVAKSAAIVNHVFSPLPLAGEGQGEGGASYETWVRPGIALYGAYPGFKPVMSLMAPITLIKTLKPGMTVGYNQTWTATRETKIALLRAGYGDGYPRSLSNQGHVLLHGRRVAIIGRVSMDLITVDISNLDCQVGDWVTFPGAEELAAATGTIAYEILTGITDRVERVYNNLTLNPSPATGEGLQNQT